MMDGQYQVLRCNKPDLSFYQESSITFWSPLRLQAMLFTQELLISWGTPIWLPEGALHHLKECFGQYI